MATAEITPLRRRAEKVHEFSRFFNQDLYLEGREKFWGNWVPPEIPVSPHDTFITVTEAFVERIDLLSYQAYQTPELWWVIAEVNQIFFPPEDMKIGDTLRVPAKTTLISLGLLR